MIVHVTNCLSCNTANISTSSPPSSFLNFLLLPCLTPSCYPVFLTGGSTGSCCPVWRPRWRVLCPPTTPMCGHVTVDCSASTRTWTTSWAMDWRMSRSRSDWYHSPFCIYLLSNLLLMTFCVTSSQLWQICRSKVTFLLHFGNGHGWSIETTCFWTWRSHWFTECPITPQYHTIRQHTAISFGSVFPDYPCSTSDITFAEMLRQWKPRSNPSHNQNLCNIQVSHLPTCQEWV